MLIIPALTKAAAAATLQVPAEYGTVEEAVAAAVAGDTIELAPGDYFGPVRVTVDLTLVGTGGSAVTGLHGVAGSALEGVGATLIVEGLSLTADPGPWPIAGFVSSTVALTDVAVTGSPAEAPAAVVAVGTALTLDRSVFSANLGTDGHLSLTDAPLVATDVDLAFGGDRSRYHVGLRALRSPLVFTGGTISDHPYEAIHYEEAGATFAEVTFSRNHQAVRGGETLTVTDSTFDGAHDADLIFGGNVTIQRSVFDGVNGIVGYGDTLVVEDSVFLGSPAEKVVDGAADESWFRRNIVSGGTANVYMSQGEVVVIEDNEFLDNRLTEPAASIGQQSEVHVNRNLFRGNSATWLVYVGASQHTAVVGNRFCDNHTAYLVDWWYYSGNTVIATNLFANNRLRRYFLEDSSVLHANYGPQEYPAYIGQNTFVGNTTDAGVTSYVLYGDLDPALTRFDNNLVISQRGNPAIAAPVSLGYNLFWDNAGGDLLGGGALPPTNLAADPLFDTWRPGSPCSAQDLVLTAGSPAIDAGDPAVLDADGSTSDIGFTGGPSPDPLLAVDADADGSSARFDCDDADGSRYPGAVEACDDVDQDCDGDPHLGWVYVDADGDGLGDTPTGASGDVCALAGTVLDAGDCDDTDPAVGAGGVFYTDTDGDGFGLDGTEIVACPAVGMVGTAGDCDDADGDISPAATERCNGVDDDCDGTPDQGVTSTWYPDEDGDGVGDAAGALDGCGGEGLVSAAGDCDDHNPALTDICDVGDEDPKPEGGCGCQTTGGLVGWGAALGAFAVGQRRRRPGRRAQQNS